MRSFILGLISLISASALFFTADQNYRFFTNNYPQSLLLPLLSLIIGVVALIHGTKGGIILGSIGIFASIMLLIMVALS